MSVLLLSLLLLSPLTALPPTTTPHSEDLKKNVSQFCALLKAHEKADAMKFVHPDDINNFINRKEQPVLSWKILETEFTSSEHAKVTVQFEQLVLGNKIPVPRLQNWQKTDQGWKVRIRSPQEIFNESREAFIRANKPSLPETLSVFPEQLKIYKLTRPKAGSFVVRNGLQNSAEILSFEFDTSKFEIVHLPEVVEPGDIERIRVVYLGEAQEENLQSEAVLRIKQDGEIKTFQVPVIYNYTDEVTRWLLSKKAAQEMERLEKQPTPPKPPIPPSPQL